ncbi:MAG: peptide MFS transporter [Chlorobi bacterium]|nr:peptide MFS transporter [Chlorobiota bacterium]
MAGLGTVIKSFKRVFWISNLMELFERWAWYGFYNALALYLTLSRDTGALGFTQAQKGLIMGTGSMLLYFLPLITGAIADKIGYKKVLILSFTMYVMGYFMMGHFQTYGTIFFAYIFLATAGAFFKPIVSAMIAKTTTAETSSIGFGIFYMMINVGGFIGPFVSGLLYKINWNYVFWMSMITIAINYIFVFFFFREPGREKNTASLGKNIVQALQNILVTLSNWRYVIFLVIMILFWTAFNQLYYSFPVFLDDWVDLDKLGILLGMEPGQLTAVTLTSLDAFFIILLQLIISSIAMRFKPLQAMMTGIMILAGGLFFMFTSQHAWVVIFGILVFAIGEMASSPKFTEYVGRIAPPDKKALYMGTSFLPIAAGHFLAGILSGKLYAGISEKFTLLTREIAARGISMPEISAGFTQNDYVHRAQEIFGMNSTELNRYLWDHYHPSHIWILFSGIAVFASILLFFYDRFILKGRVANDHT